MAENENKAVKAERRRRWIEEHRPVLNRVVATMVATFLLAVAAACYLIWRLTIYAQPAS